MSSRKKAKPAPKAAAKKPAKPKKPVPARAGKPAPAKPKKPAVPARPAPARKPAPAKAKAPARAPAPPRAAKPAPRPAKPAARPAKAPEKPREKGAAAPRPGEKVPAPRPGAAPVAPRPAGAPAAPGPRSARPPKKSGRRLHMRRGPNGELLAPGELLLPGGPQSAEEVHYLLRGCVAAEHPMVQGGVDEIAARRGPDTDRGELERQAETLRTRFEGGPIEALLPARPPQPRRSFQGVVERAKGRRREIGAFLRGLDIGRTETSHMDAHGEASLEMLMKWAAHLENLADAEEPAQADYAQFHRVLDQLDGNTEGLIVDVEGTLRRLRDRLRA